MSSSFLLYVADWARIEKERKENAREKERKVREKHKKNPRKKIRKVRE
jgi:hypothetical protein